MPHMPSPQPPDAAPEPALLPSPPDALCLDFANTRYWRGSPEPTEELRGAENLLRWCEGAGLVGATEAAALRDAWSRDPAAGQSALAAALALREAMFRLFAAGTAGAPPRAGDLAALNDALAAAPARRRLR